jgi:hypothetical protein
MRQCASSFLYGYYCAAKNTYFEFAPRNPMLYSFQRRSDCGIDIASCTRPDDILAGNAAAA